MNNSPGLAGKLHRRQFLKALGLATGALCFDLRAHAQATLRIGILGGSKTPHGEAAKNGADLAAAEVNAAGGVLNRRVEIVFSDLGSESDPALAATAYQDLVTSKGCDVVAGLFLAESAAAAASLAPRMRKPLLITGATSGGTEQVARDIANFKYVFRCGMINTPALAFDSLRFAREYVQALLTKRTLSNNRLALIGEDSGASRGFRQLLSPQLRAVGLEVVADTTIALGTRDLGPVFQQIQGAGLVFTHFSDSTLGTLFATQWAAARAPSVFGFNAALQSDALVSGLRGAATGIVLLDLSADAALSAKTKPFYANYARTYGTRPVQMGGSSYDTVFVVAEAVRRANSTDADRLVDALEKTDSTGATGRIRFYSVEDQQIDRTGRAVAHDTIYGANAVKGQTLYDGVRPLHTQIRADGSRVVLFPPEAATGNYELPPHLRG